MKIKKNSSGLGKKITVGINASFLRKPNNGIGQVTFNFLRKLSELRTDDLEFILYLEEELPKKLSLPKNFQTKVFLPLWKRDDLIRKIWWEKYLLPNHARRDKCDVFISMYQCPTVIAEETRHLMIVHDIIPRIFPEYLDNLRKKRYQKLTEKAIKKAGKVIAISKRTEKDLIEHLGITGDKITLNYIDVDSIYKKRPVKDKIAKVLKKYKLKPGYILAGGGMEVRKNVEGVIRAYKLLLEKNKNHVYVDEMPILVIYGKLLPGLSLALDAQNLVRELNLTKNVRFLGLTRQEDMPAVFSQSSMFVYPSHYEGFGLPPLEAMNQGIPTIISKKSSLPEVGGDGVLYCNCDDARDIAMVMRNILVNKELRTALSIRAKMQAKKFLWDKFTKKILNIILELGR